MLKKICFLLILGIMLCVSSCADNVPNSGVTDVNTVDSSKDSKETPGESGTMPEEWIKAAVEPTVYEAKTVQGPDEVACSVSMRYVDLRQGDRCAVYINLTHDGRPVDDYTAFFSGMDETTADIPIQCYDQQYFYADIPADASCATYNLVICAESCDYEGVIENVVTVSEREKTAFSFAYALENTTYSAQSEDVVTFSLAVFNEGDPFILYDNDYAYNVSSAYFEKNENGKKEKIEVMWYTHDGILWEE